MKVDLHIHTTASDGTWTPEKLIKRIISLNIEVFAVTDHDTLDNLDEVSRLAEDAGVSFIPGVEICASNCNGVYHILGYGIDRECDELKKTLSYNRGSFEEQDINRIQFLEENGYSVSVKEHGEYKYNRERGGWKGLNYLVDKGLCQNHRDYFTLFSDMGDAFNSSNLVSIKTAVSSIQNAGGIPILAHPGGNVYRGDYKSVVDVAFEQGIHGIECFHPENSAEVTKYCLDFCEKNDLYITGGSDCHGEFVKERALGKPEVWGGQIRLENLLD